MTKGFWRGQSESGSSQPFDATEVDWVSVNAGEFFFEPHCAEFKPTGSGELVVIHGKDATRHRGVEVVVRPDGIVDVWVPIGGRVFWCPSLTGEDSSDEPWETRLQEVDHYFGEIMTP